MKITIVDHSLSTATVMPYCQRFVFICRNDPRWQCMLVEW